MRSRHRAIRISCLLLSLGVLAAAAPSEPVSLVRQGNMAFARGDFPTAVAWYTQAEERTLDPGQVAFNEGVGLYQLGQYREAELRFRRCREDAEGPRHTRVLYNLGNCLLQQARATDTRRPREAVGLYEQCLQRADLEPALAEDVRHNLELARLLWQKAKASRDSQNSSDDETGSDKPQPEEAMNDAQQGAQQAGMTIPDGDGKPERVAEQPGDANVQAGKTDQPPPPGKGNLPPIPDEDELTSLSPEDAEEYLKRAAARILREHSEYRQRPMPASAANVRDW
jgi:Flp pilus assembly protein TadD